MICYKILDNNKVWVINEDKGEQIPAWCLADPSYNIVKILPDDIVELIAINTLSNLIEGKLSELYDQYWKANYESIDYMSTTFEADNYSQNLIVDVLSAGSVPSGFYWLDLYNNPVQMTYSDLQGLSATILMRNQLNFIKYQGLKAQAKAATEAELPDIVW